MKKKELQTFRSKSSEELTKLVSKMRLDLVKTKVDISVSKEKNLKKIKNLAHDLAQVLTVKREKEILEKDQKEMAKK